MSRTIYDQQKYPKNMKTSFRSIATIGALLLSLWFNASSENPNESIESPHIESLETLRLRSEQLLQKLPLYKKEYHLNEVEKARKKLHVWRENDQINLREIEETRELAFENIEVRGIPNSIAKDTYHMARRAALGLENLPDISPANAAKLSPTATADDPMETLTRHRFQLFKQIHLNYVAAILATNEAKTIVHLKKLLKTVQKISTHQARLTEEKIREFIHIQEGVTQVSRLLEQISSVSSSVILDHKNLTRAQENAIISFIDGTFELPRESFQQNWTQRPSVREDFIRIASIIRQFAETLSRSTGKTVENLNQFATRLTPTVASRQLVTSTSREDLDKKIIEIIASGTQSIRNTTWSKAILYASSKYETLSNSGPIKPAELVNSQEYLRHYSLCAADILCRIKIQIDPTQLSRIHSIERILFGNNSIQATSSGGSVDALAFELIKESLEKAISNANSSNPEVEWVIKQIKASVSPDKVDEVTQLLGSKGATFTKERFDSPEGNVWSSQTFLYQLNLKEKTVVIPQRLVQQTFAKALVRKLFLGSDENLSPSLPARLGLLIVDLVELETGKVQHSYLHTNWNLNEYRRLTENLSRNKMEDSQGLLIDAELRLASAMLEISRAARAYVHEHSNSSQFFSNRLKEALKLFGQVGSPLFVKGKVVTPSLSPVDVELILASFGTSIEQISNDFFATRSHLELIENLQRMDQAAKQ